MTSKFTHPNIAIAKSQVQRARNSLKQHSKISPPKSTEMLNYWVQCFDYDNWQHFIRQVNGHSINIINSGTVNKDNYLLVSEKLHKIITGYDLEHIKWAVIASFLKSDTDSDLIKRLLIKTLPHPITNQLNELHMNGFIDIDTRYSKELKEEYIVGYVPTELGRYAAAITHERNIGHLLSSVDLVQFGLSNKLCKLQSIISAF